MFSFINHGLALLAGILEQLTRIADCMERDALAWEQVPDDEVWETNDPDDDEPWRESVCDDY